jgi:hypothetical protein
MKAGSKLKLLAPFTKAEIRHILHLPRRRGHRKAATAKGQNGSKLRKKLLTELKSLRIMCGLLRRKAFGFDAEAAESTASQKGVDGAEKPAIMGGSLRRKRRSLRRRR